MSDEKFGSITLPCFIAAGRELIRVRNGNEIFSIKRPLRGNRFLFSNGASPRLTVFFIIDRTGAYRQVKQVKKYHEWAAPLAWLFDFVTVECEVLPGEQLTADQMYQKLKSTCDLSDKNFPNAGRLARFLRKLPSEKIFNEDEFKKFWEKYNKPLS